MQLSSRHVCGDQENYLEQAVLDAQMGIQNHLPGLNLASYKGAFINNMTVVDFNIPCQQIKIAQT